MVKWLNPALDYILRWVEFQIRQHEQPGCVIAIAHQGRIAFEEAFGYANIAKGLPLTPRHRFFMLRLAVMIQPYANAILEKLYRRVLTL